MMTFTSNTLIAEQGDIPIISDDGKYHLQIVMFQWQFDIYNLRGNETIEDAIDEKKHIASSGVDGTIGPLLVNTGIIIDVYSRDVQHGFSIKELGLALATNRPTPGNILGDKITAETVLPSEPMNMTSFCHIFCGLGHPDEKMEFIVVANLDDYTNSKIENIKIPLQLLTIIISIITIVVFTRKIR